MNQKEWSGEEAGLGEPEQKAENKKLIGPCTKAESPAETGPS